jgi:hypothetical protein
MGGKYKSWAKQNVIFKTLQVSHTTSCHPLCTHTHLHLKVTPATETAPLQHTRHELLLQPHPVSQGSCLGIQEEGKELALLLALPIGKKQEGPAHLSPQVEDSSPQAVHMEGASEGLPVLGCLHMGPLAVPDGEVHHVPIQLDVVGAVLVQADQPLST